MYQTTYEWWWYGQNMIDDINNNVNVIVDITLMWQELKQVESRKREKAPGHRKWVGLFVTGDEAWSN